MSTNVGSLAFDASINLDQFQRDARQMINTINSITDAQNKQSQGIEDFAKKAAQAAAGFLSIQAAEGFVKSMIEVRGQFQQIEVAFGTMLKSKDAADKLMAQAVQLAAITPFTLQEVASGAKQLLAYGFAAKDVTKQLETLGNIASGVGSDLNSVVYLYGTLKASGRVTQIDINQFAGRGIPIYQALADVMKINVDQVRSYVSAGKIGFPQVEAAFNSLTSSGGQFFNLMQQQSLTLTGQLSNLEDAWDRMLNALGKDNEGFFADAIGGTIKLVDNYKQIIDIIEVLIITYGAYRAAVILNAVTLNGWSFAEGVNIQLLIAKEAVMNSVNSAVAGGALTIAAYTAIIGSLAVVTYALVQEQNAQEIAQNAVNKATRVGEQAAQAEDGKIQALIKTIQDHTSSVADKKQAYDDLQKEAPAYLRTYTMEEIAAGKAASAVALFEGSIRHLAETESKYASYKDLSKKIDELNEKGIDAVSTFDSLAEKVKIILGGDYFTRAFNGTLDDKIVDNRIKANKDAQANLATDTLVKARIDAAAKEKAAKKETEDAIAKFNKLLADGAVKNFDLLFKSAPNKDSLDKLQKALTDTYENIAPGDLQKDLIKKKIQQVDKFVADEYGTSIKTQVKAANDRAKFLDELSKTEAKATGKALDQNGEELNAIHTKYEELRKKAAALKLGNGIAQRIDNLEKTETGNVKYEQDTKKLKIELDKQKNLQVEYEADVEKFGIDAAKNKYAGLLIASKSYYTQLLEDQKAITDIPTAKRTGNQNERLKEVNDLIAEETKRQRTADDERLKAAIDASETFNTARLKALDDYLKQKKIIEDANDIQDKSGRLDELKNATTDKIQQLKAESIRKLEVYKDLSGDISKLNEDVARKDIASLNKVVDAAVKLGLLSKKDALEFKKLTSDASIALNDKTYDKMLIIAGGLDTISDSANKLGGSFGSAMGIVLSSLSGALKGVANIGKLSEAFKNAKTDADKFSAGTSLVAAGLSSVIDLVGIFTSASKQRKEAEQAYSDAILKSQNDIQLSLIEQIRLQEQLNGNLFLKNYKDDILNASKALVVANKDFADSLNALQNGQAKAGTHSAISGAAIGKGAVAGATIGATVGPIGAAVGAVVGGLFGLFGGKKKVDTLVPLLQQYPDLITKAKDGTDQFNDSLAKNLIQNNLVSDSTKILLQNTIDLNVVRQASIDQINADIKDLAGSLGDDLRNSLVQAFEDGSDAAKAFGGDVSKVIENIVSQFLFNNIFGQQFTDLEAKMKASFGIGGDGSVVDDLADFYKTAGPSIKQFQDALAAAKAEAASQGIDIFDPATSQQSDLTNAVKGITAPQADLLSSQFGGQRIATLEGNQIAINNGKSLNYMAITGDKTLDQLVLIQANTFRGANNTDGLVPTLKDVKILLGSIDKKAGANAGTAAANGIPL